MKNILIFITLNLIATNTFSQEIEETVIESTETSSNRRQNVRNIYKKGEHYVTGNIENEIFIIKNNSTNLYGLQDINGNLLVKPMFKNVDLYASSKNRIVVSIGYSMIGVINRKGEIIIPLEYSSINSKKSKQVFIIGKNYNNYSIVDYNGASILEGDFESISVYEDIKVKRNDAYGVFNFDGKIILPIEFDKIEYNSKFEFFDVTKNGKSTIIKRNGEKLFLNNYTNIKNYGSYNSLKFLVEKDNKKGFISFDEKIIVPIKFQDVKNKNNGQLYIVKQNNLWGVYDSYFDQFLINPLYKEVQQISKTIYILISENKKEFRNIEYKTTVDVSKYNFKDYYLSNSLFLKTQKDQNFGMLNIANGKLIVPPKYNSIYVKTGFLTAYNEDSKTYSVYSIDGKVLAQNLNNVKSINHKLYKLTKKGKAGLIYNGKLITKINLDVITPYKDLNLAILKKDNTFTLIDYVSQKIILKESKEKISISPLSKIIKYNNKNYFYILGKLKEY